MFEEGRGSRIGAIPQRAVRVVVHHGEAVARCEFCGCCCWMIRVGKRKAGTTGDGASTAIVWQQLLLFITVRVQTFRACAVGTGTGMLASGRRMMSMRAFALINDHGWTVLSHDE